MSPPPKPAYSIDLSPYDIETLEAAFMHCMSLPPQELVKRLNSPFWTNEHDIKAFSKSINDRIWGGWLPPDSKTMEARYKAVDDEIESSRPMPKIMTCHSEVMIDLSNPLELQENEARALESILSYFQAYCQDKPGRFVPRTISYNFELSIGTLLQHLRRQI